MLWRLRRLVRQTKVNGYALSVEVDRRKAELDTAAARVEFASLRAERAAARLLKDHDGLLHTAAGHR